jgi:hypothetical protein
MIEGGMPEHEAHQALIALIYAMYSGESLDSSDD